MSYFFHLLTYFGIFAILTMSLNIVIGYCGLLTLAHAGYFAVGAYAYAVGTLCWGMDFLSALLFASVVGGVTSLLISIPTWRLKSDFFVMNSIAVQVLFYSAAHNWTSSTANLGTIFNMSNGPLGIAGITRPDIWGYKFNSLASMAGLSLMMMMLFVGVCWLLLTSPWGRVLQCMRDDELATRNLGKHVHFLKIQALFIASSMAAIAGALYASYTSFINPSLASIDQSILLLTMLLVGGAGNIYGPLAGAAILLLIPEILRFFPVPDSVAAEIRVMLYGLLLIIIVRFMPSGVAGKYKVN